MARNHSEMRPGFYIHSESYWSKERGGPVRLTGPDGSQINDRAYDEVMIGMYDPVPEAEGGGGTTGEFGMRWYRGTEERELFNDSVVSRRPDNMRLEVYDDGWSSLARMPRLLMLLNTLDVDCGMGTRRKIPTPQEFGRMLVDIGFTDRTRRKSPYEEEVLVDE